MDKEIKDIVIPVYYSVNDNGNIKIDEDSIREEFEKELLRVEKETGNA